MGIMNIFGIRYATLPRLERLMKKTLKPMGLETKRVDSNTWVVSDCTTELGVLTFKVEEKQFTLLATDAFGYTLHPITTYTGKNWRLNLTRRLNRIGKKMTHQWCPAGHVINPEWNDMMRQIAFPEDDSHLLPRTFTEETGEKEIDIDDGRSYLSPAMATALYLGVIDERYA